MVSERMCVEIGTALGVDQYAIDAFLYNNQHDITTAGYKILRKWVEMQENRVIAWNELAAALRICELNSWVIEILQKMNVLVSIHQASVYLLHWSFLFKS